MDNSISSFSRLFLHSAASAPPSSGMLTKYSVRLGVARTHCRPLFMKQVLPRLRRPQVPDSASALASSATSSSSNRPSVLMNGSKSPAVGSSAGLGSGPNSGRMVGKAGSGMSGTT